MPINPQFLAARLGEHRNRMLTHVGLAEPIDIPFEQSVRCFRVPQCLLTERIRLELIVAENAFVTGRPPMLGDVFVVLWRMHPEFRRPLPGRLRAIRGPRAGKLHFLSLAFAFGSWRAARLHRWLSRQVARCDLPVAVARINDRFAQAEQDAPGAPLEAGRRSAIAPLWCYYDDLVDYMSSTYHIPPGEVLDLPRALVHQLYRNRQLSRPDGELNIFAPSDALL